MAAKFKGRASSLMVIRRYLLVTAGFVTMAKRETADLYEATLRADGRANSWKSTCEELQHFCVVLRRTCPRGSLLC